MQTWINFEKKQITRRRYLGHIQLEGHRVLKLLTKLDRKMQENNSNVQADLELES